MVAQRGAFSTTLLLIESQDPVVSNKTNLIDRVYKNPCTAEKDLFFRRSLFIYSLSFPHLAERGAACGTRKLGLFYFIWKRKDAEMKSKGFKIRSLASAINQRQGSLGVRLGLGVQNEPLKQQVQSTANSLVDGAGGCKAKEEWKKQNYRVQNRTKDIL